MSVGSSKSACRKICYMFDILSYVSYNTAVQTPEIQNALRTVKDVLADLELRVIEFFSEWLVALLMPARYVLETRSPRLDRASVLWTCLKKHIKSFICKPFRFSIKCSNKVWQLMLTPGKKLISIPIIQFIWPYDQMIIPPVLKRSSGNKIKRALTECIKLLLGLPDQPSSDSTGRSRHVFVVLAAQLVRGTCVADRLPVMVRFRASPRVRLKTVDPPKGNGLRQKK